MSSLSKKPYTPSTFAIVSTKDPNKLKIELVFWGRKSTDFVSLGMPYVEWNGCILESMPSQARIYIPTIERENAMAALQRAGYVPEK